MKNQGYYDEMPDCRPITDQEEKEDLKKHVLESVDCFDSVEPSDECEMRKGDSRTKQYTGTKVVRARPLDKYDFCKDFKNMTIDQIREKEENQLGYLVEYEDGYKSWSPKTVFDKAYKPSETFLDRLIIEIDELRDKHAKLYNFIAPGTAFDKLDAEQRRLLVWQENFMASYLTVLVERAKLITSKETANITEYQEINQENLKAGFKYVLPLEIFPNNLGINLCSVKGLEVVRQPDGQLVTVRVDFKPAEFDPRIAVDSNETDVVDTICHCGNCKQRPD